MKQYLSKEPTCRYGDNNCIELYNVYSVEDERWVNVCGAVSLKMLTRGHNV